MSHTALKSKNEVKKQKKKNALHRGGTFSPHPGLVGEGQLEKCFPIIYKNPGSVLNTTEN